MKTTSADVAALLGRFLFVLLFFFAAMGYLTGWENSVKMLQGAIEPVGQRIFGDRLPLVANILLGGATAFLLLGSLMVLVGFLTRIGSLLIFVFLIPTTILFHNFWALTGMERTMQLGHFLSNLALMGGAMLLIAFGAGALSLDRVLRKK